MRRYGSRDLMTSPCSVRRVLLNWRTRGATAHTLLLMPSMLRVGEFLRICASVHVYLCMALHVYAGVFSVYLQYYVHSSNSYGVIYIYLTQFKTAVVSVR